MIHRLVKMTFREECVDDFRSMFEARKERIFASEGCHRLELLTDHKDPRIHFTLSIWTSEEHLDQYRHSAFFAETWALTKAMFEEKAQAWTLDSLADLDHIEK